MLKKLRGGYNISISGKPSTAVEVLPEPERLIIPLASRRLRFTEIKVANGQRVKLGQALAADPENYSVPLLAPRAGKIDIHSVAGHVVIADISHSSDESTAAGNLDVRQKLVELGAWQSVADAHTGAIPDPIVEPRAVIVSTMQTEPFLAAGNAQYMKRQQAFVRGLTHLQSLLEYQPIYLVMPQEQTEFTGDILDILRGHAFVTIVRVPSIYPYDNFTLLARNLGLNRLPGSPVWAMSVDAVLAFDRVCTLSRPCTVRIISLGGPPVDKPVHLKAMAGYPIDSILTSRVAPGEHRVIKGGCLTGKLLDTQHGLDVECNSLTVLPEHNRRELLGFMRPGWNRKSYSQCFLSSVTGGIAKILNTAMNGEHRACVTCGLCESVCPASLLPWLFHKLAYGNELEEMERARIDLCIECGLCSFVCPSKIDVREEIRNAKDEIRQEAAG